MKETVEPTTTPASDAPLSPDAFMDSVFGEEGGTPEPTAAEPATSEPDLTEEPVSQEPATLTPEEPLETGEVEFEDPFAQLEGELETSSADDTYDAETEEQAKGMDTKAGAKWKALRAELKDYKKQIAEHSVASEEVSKLKQQLEAYDTIKAEYETLKNERALHDYTKTDEYQEKIIKPFNDLQALANTIAESSEEVSAEDVMDAISKRSVKAQDDAISALEQSLDSRSISRLNQMADTMQVLYQQENSIREGAETKLQEYEANQQKQATLEQEKRALAYQSSVDGVFDKYSDKIPTLLNESGGQADGVGGLVDKAKALNFTTMSEDQQAYAAMSAVLLPRLVKELKTARTENGDLKRLNNEYRGSAPSPTPSGTTPTAPATSPSDVLNAFYNS